MIDRIAARLLMASEGLLKLPVLWQDPAVAWLCVRRARSAIIALVVCASLLTWLVPPVVNGVLESIYPEENKLLGLVKTKQPEVEILSRRIMATLWICSGGLIAMLLGLAIAGATGSVSSQASGNTIAEPRVPPDRAGRRSVNTSTIRGPDRYQIERELGRGNMGVVYKAADPVLGRQVALKKLPAWLLSNDALIARFRQEAKALARVSHPGIVQVYDLLESAEGLWIVLELVDGGDLAGLLQQRGPMRESKVIALGTEMAEALAYAHQSGVIHRDFKPANVLLAQTERIKIADFGIAKIAESSELTHDGAVIGSPRYMSPEQAAGKTVDERTDVYALGVCLYEMITGVTPFNGDTAAVLAQCITQSPVPVNQHTSNASGPFNDLVMRMLAKSPGDRIQTMAQVCSELLNCGSPETKTISQSKS